MQQIVNVNVQPMAKTDCKKNETKLHAWKTIVLTK
jgi:hypothetical protein